MSTPSSLSPSSYFVDIASWLVRVIVLLSQGHFEHSREAATLAIATAREKRAGKGPVSDSWDIDDHLIALKARIVPLRTIGIELLSAAVHAHGALWPSATGKISVTELATMLKDAGNRLHAWKRSAVRAGADQELQHVLSWYEGLDLEVIKSPRVISEWYTDPAKIRLRQETAHRLASWADPDSFITSLIASDSESDYEDGGEAEDASDADAEIPEAGDAETTAVTEITTARDAADPPPPEVPLPETSMPVPSTTANAEETVIVPPSADQSEKPVSPIAP